MSYLYSDFYYSYLSVIIPFTVFFTVMKSHLYGITINTTMIYIEIICNISIQYFKKI